jgi:hypothetical protein
MDDFRPGDFGDFIGFVVVWRFDSLQSAGVMEAEIGHGLHG